MSNMLVRTLTGAVYIGLIAFATLWHPFVFITVFCILFGLCFYELSQMLKYQNKLYILLTVAGSAFILYRYISKFYYGNINYQFTDVTSQSSWGVILPIVLFLIGLVVIFKTPMELGPDTGKIIFTIVYLALPFGMAFTFDYKSLFGTGYPTIIFLMFVLIWISDTFAYLVGKFLGKRKLSSISEKKTIEGLIGGIIFTVASGIGIESYYPDIKGNWILIATIIAIAAPIGDLAASKLKRVFGVKDSSNWIPGHGGFLDRLDSFLVCSVALYIYFAFI